jgi:hypothetical protein
MNSNSTDYIPWQLRQELVDGWGMYVDEKIEQRWKFYLLTFMFNRLSGRENAILEQMRNEIKRFYASLVKRVVRKPTSVNSLHKLPILIGCPDFAGSRHGRMTLQELTINQGLAFSCRRSNSKTVQIARGADQAYPVELRYLSRKAKTHQHD